MEVEPYNSNSMKSKHIQNVNEAILVLRHFIELSAKLLPFLEELEKKKRPTADDLMSKQKIIEVYRSYDFDTSTSKILMNSDVLDLIKSSFETISSCESRCSRRSRSNSLRQFLSEHRRLKQNWEVIMSN